MNRSNAFFSVITGLLLFSAAGTFAAHHENKSHSNINGVFTLAFELGAEEAPWSVSIEDQEGATSVTRFQLKQTGTFANGSAFEANEATIGSADGSVTPAGSWECSFARLLNHPGFKVRESDSIRSQC